MVPVAVKVQVAVDVDSGIVHSLEATTAKVSDSRIWDVLLHGNERSICADKGYVGAERGAAFSKDGEGRLARSTRIARFLLKL